MPSRPSHQSVSRPGRPGTIRAIAAAVVLVLLGVGALTGLRMTETGGGSAMAQGGTSAPPAKDLAIRAMARLVAPPAPGSFSLGDEPEEVPLLLASDSTPTANDCVKNLDHALSSTIVQFDEGSAALTPVNIAQMARISDLIMACDGAYVMVGGHADGSGDDAVNLALSWDRADRTLNHLLLLGVDPFAVEAVGYGARAPLSQGSNEEDGADRRVDFKVMRKP